MNYEKLMELLNNMDKKTPEIICTKTSEGEKVMALNAIYLMKLEQIDNYIAENCCCGARLTKLYCQDKPELYLCFTVL